MRRRCLILFLHAALLAAVLPAPAIADSETTGAEPVVTIEDFAVLAGAGWSGTLSYLNYNSDDRSTIPVKLQVEEPGRRSLKYAIQYPGEEEYNSRERIRVSRDGREIDGYRVARRERLEDGALIITTEGPGEDDNRPAEFRFVYTVAPNRFSIRKDVRFEDEESFFNRNEYAFER